MYAPTLHTLCTPQCIPTTSCLFVSPYTQLLYRSDWMEEFQIAVSFLDRYLARNATERHELRGIALGCILMAAKVIGDELSVQEVAKIGCMHYREVKVTTANETPAILCFGGKLETLHFLASFLHRNTRRRLGWVWDGMAPP